MYLPTKLRQAAICLLIIAAMLVAVPFVAGAEESENVPIPTGESQMLYLKPNENWQAEDAWFVLYYFDFNDHYDCVAMTDEDGDGIYEAILPEGYPNFLFYRMDSAVTEFDGDAILHQTDCFEYAEDMYCFVLAEESWEAGDWEAAPAMEDAADETVEETVEETESTEPAEEAQPEMDETADAAVPEDQSASEETESPVENAEEAVPQAETNIFYLELAQVDEEFTWKVRTQTADYDVTEEAEGLYSVELPADTETITICGEKENHQIGSVEISLEDIQDNNCIVALAWEEGAEVFGIKWGIYDPESGEITFGVQEDPVSIEEPAEETVVAEPAEALDSPAAEETESEGKTVGEEATVGEEVEDSENTDAVS